MKVKDIFVKSKNWFVEHIGNKTIVYGIKYLPIVCTILATIHIGLLLFGYYEPVTIGLATALLIALMILVSIRFKFCPLHKAMIIFMALVVLCVSVQTRDNFGSILTFSRLAVFTFGACLSLISIHKHKTEGSDEINK